MSVQQETLREALTGISGILVTPFNDQDRIAPTLLEPIIDRAVKSGVHILTANGNTSEFYGLTASEAETMVHAITEQVAGRIPVLAGVGRSIHEATALARSSATAGAAALMIHQPPDPFSSPRGLLDYVKRVADAGGGLPVVLYLRNDTIGLHAIQELCAIPEVIGVKWACPTPLRLQEAMEQCSPDLTWVCGLAEAWAPPLYAVGAKGFTSGLINVWPERSVEIHSALASGDYAKAQTLISGIRAFEAIRAEEQGGTNVTTVKAALRHLGLDCGHTRPPSAWPLSRAQQSALESLMKAWPDEAKAFY